MAKLILIQREDNPDNNAGASVFAYFDGTPSKADLGAAPGQTLVGTREMGRQVREALR